MSIKVESLRNAGLELLQPLWHYLCVLGKMQSWLPRLEAAIGLGGEG